MLRLLASTVLYVLGNAIGLVVASRVLPGFSIDFWSIVIVASIFTLIVVVITPLLIKISLKNVPQMSGGVALVAILVGLIGTSMFSEGLKITGLSTWILAPLIIWIIALIAGLILPLFLFKKTLEKVKES
jgi:uncharacterized membrane protein YvlD (DUF360 family)